MGEQDPYRFYENEVDDMLNLTRLLDFDFLWQRLYLLLMPKDMARGSSEEVEYEENIDLDEENEIGMEEEDEEMGQDAKDESSGASNEMLQRGGAVGALPDDVIVNILSRLPADCVLDCRRVCRKWRALTSSPYFAELHIKRATTTTAPSLFVQWLDCDKSVKQGQLNFFIYDKAGQKANNNNYYDDGRRNIITKILPSSGKAMYHHGAVVLGSCNGLLMFEASKQRATVFVFNPVTQDLIILPTPFRHTTPCGIYFHPLTSEYKLLLCTFKGRDIHQLQTYYTSSLKSKVWNKHHYSPSCKTRSTQPAILLNGSLHWMVNRNKEVNEEDSIVLAQMRSWQGHENMYLSLGTRDDLYLCHISWGEVIRVWVLEDYAGWVWNRRYKVNLDWAVKRFPFTTAQNGVYSPKDVKVLGIHNGELMMWRSRGLFSYDLEKNIVSKVAFKLEGCDIPTPWASAYTKSLVRLE
ncbi:hypothetical protein LguiA_001407 [Lonicera macranthoides]